MSFWSPLTSRPSPQPLPLLSFIETGSYMLSNWAQLGSKSWVQTILLPLPQEWLKPQTWVTTTQTVFPLLFPLPLSTTLPSIILWGQGCIQGFRHARAAPYHYSRALEISPGLKEILQRNIIYQTSSTINFQGLTNGYIRSFPKGEAEYSGKWIKSGGLRGCPGEMQSPQKSEWEGLVPSSPSA